MRPAIRTLVAALAVAAYSGCGEEEQAPVVAPSPTAKKKAEVVAPVAATVSVEYAYNPINKRDPFRSFAIDPGSRSPGDAPTEVVTCNEPLCQVDIDELAVVAVVSGDANPLAMVEDRNGIGHIVRRNSRMGKQGGKVTQILRDCIVVTSFISGGADGKPMANKQNMCVKTDERSAEPLDLLKGKEFTQ